MIYSYVGNRCLHLGCAAVVATALTVAVTAPQPSRIPMPVESHIVQLEAAVASAVANSSAASVTDGPSAANLAAVNPFSFVGDLVTKTVQAAIWYLASPVTIPISFAMSFADIFLNYAPHPHPATVWDGFLGNYWAPLNAVGSLISSLFNVNATTAAALPVAASSTANASARPAAATTPPASVSPSAATVAAATEDPLAIPRTIAQIALTAVGFAISPLWYLGFPITIPLMFLVANSAFGTVAPCQVSCEVQGFQIGFKLLTFVGGWLGFPLVVGSLANLIFPPPADTTATTTPAAASRARSAATMGNSTDPATTAPQLRRSHARPSSVSRQASAMPEPRRSSRPAAAIRSSDASKAASTTAGKKFVG